MQALRPTFRWPLSAAPAALGLFAALLLSACGNDDGGAAAPRGASAAVVTTTRVEPTQWVDAIEALGTARANESVTITAKVTETVEDVAFEDGDVVEAGDVLVDLSGRVEVAELQEAQAAYKEAQQQYERQRSLVEQGTIARSQLDTQVATRDAALARVEAIRARLSDRVITAPFDGVLGFRQVSPGTLVTPGTPIASLDDISTIKLDFSVPETFLASLEPGQTIAARSAAYPDRAFEGTVTTVGSRVDPVTRAVTVRAEIPNADHRLRPGMLLAVDLYQPPRETLAIPELAVIQIGTGSYVFRVGEDDTVSRVPVELGARRRGEVEVVDGLQAGQRIVVEGTVKLRDGARIVEAGDGASAGSTAAAGG